MRNNILSLIVATYLTTGAIVSANDSFEAKKVMLVNSSSKLYLYKEPNQNASRVKITKPFGAEISIGECNKYGWCATQDGYVKGIWLKEKDNVITEKEIPEVKKETNDASEPAKEKLEKTQDVIDKPKLIKIRLGSQKVSPIEIKKEIVVEKVDTTEQVVTPKKTESIKKEDTKLDRTNKGSFFYGISLGFSSLHTAKNDLVGNVPLIREVDDRGIHVTLELGYYTHEDIFLTAGINYQEYNDIKVYNYLLSANKKFTVSTFNPYIGLVAGLSSLELTKSHINSSISESKGNEYTLGIQAGLEYPFLNEYIFFTQFQYLGVTHTTQIEVLSNKSEIIRDNFSNVSVGVRW